MPTLTTVVSFNFTGADGAPVEAVHTSLALITVTSSGYLGIGTNRLVNLFANATNQIVRDTGAYSNNQFARGIVGGFTGGGSTRAHIFAVQVSADTGGSADFYAAIIYNTTPRQTDLVRVDNGVPTVLASSTAVAWVDSDECALLILDGELTVYRNVAATAIAHTDASPLTGGKPGFGHRDTSGGPVLWIESADLGNVTADVLSTISGSATLDDIAASGSLTSAAPSTLSGGATLDDVAAAGNLGTALGRLTSGELETNNSSPHTSAPFEAFVSDKTTGALLLRKEGLTSSASTTAPTCTFTDAALPSVGTQVRVTWRRTDTGAEGTELLTVTA